MSKKQWLNYPQIASSEITPESAWLNRRSLIKAAGAGAGLAALIGLYFTLQADIALAKELPEPLPPDVTRMEFDMKDKLVRQTIMTTQEDVSELKEDLDRIEEKIDKLK